MTGGLFLTLEGIEGAGKTTHLSHVEARLRGAGYDVLTTREPGGTAIGEALRDLLVAPTAAEPIRPLTELLLVFAARAQHLEERIRPALEQGRAVLCDRFTDSTYAYQGGGRRLPDETIAVLESLVQEALRPDLTLLFDLPPSLGRRRSRRRSTPDRFEAEGERYFTAVREAYLARARAEPERIAVVDASVEPQGVTRQIDAILERRLR